ncbi:hypothetical protein BD626DRAFT_480492 [Schizophyllum amplum]|uniref:Secreted protein n=1 Tax=Schizophyllum amplum TaxID=97359 RepID=A0A550CT85_9AGAR|nr:hypothetical protein BD626DRAFT_480492 [Auriculariopsis ampla]
MCALLALRVALTLMRMWTPTRSWAPHRSRQPQGTRMNLRWLGTVREVSPRFCCHVRGRRWREPSWRGGVHQRSRDLVRVLAVRFGS